MQRTREIAIIVLILVSISFLIACTLAVLQVRATVARLESEAVKTAVIANNAILEVKSNLNGTIIQAGLTLDAIHQQARTQEQYWLKTAKDTSGLVTDARAVIQRIDRETLPQLSTSMANLDASVSRVTTETAFLIQDSNRNLTRTFGETNRVLGGLGNVTNSEDIAATLAEVRKSSENVTVATGEVAEASKDVRQAVHRVTRPTNAIKAVFSFVWDKITAGFSAWNR